MDSSFLSTIAQTCIIVLSLPLLDRIIEPITSRCSKFRFKPLSDKIQQQRLLDIAEKENVTITNEVAFLSI